MSPSQFVRTGGGWMDGWVGGGRENFFQTLVSLGWIDKVNLKCGNLNSLQSINRYEPSGRKSDRRIYSGGEIRQNSLPQRMSEGGRRRPISSFLTIRLVPEITSRKRPGFYFMYYALVTLHMAKLYRDQLF